MTGGGVLLPIMANNILFYSILLNDPGVLPIMANKGRLRPKVIFFRL